MKKKYFIYIDVSKHTLDVAFIIYNQTALSKPVKDVLKQDDAVYKTYKLLNTVPGIGHVTAVYLICCSNMFTMCTSGKQLACYAGVVPFDYQSGISIKSRHHVHKMANKELRRLLHMCALSSIQNYVEFIIMTEKNLKANMQ